MSSVDSIVTIIPSGWSRIQIPACTWCIQVVRSPNFFFSGMEADRNVKVVGGDVAVL